jgi:hypothetical protein
MSGNIAATRGATWRPLDVLLGASKPESGIEAPGRPAQSERAPTFWTVVVSQRI